jgi:formylglycine-generating enzyme required for sulfatase activity
VITQAFFISKTEVSNFAYKEYLFQLKKEGKTEAYKAALPDTNKWVAYDSGLAIFTHQYFQHPSFSYFPVVNITYKQAENYCIWLSKVWQQNTGNPNINFRLPKQEEFINAAIGNEMSRNYAWEGSYLRNGKGEFMYNFKSIFQDAITRNPETNQMEIINNFQKKNIDFTAPVKSYYPNEFGIYNLNGNVAELIEGGNIAMGGSWNSGGHDVSNYSAQKVTEASPTVGFRPIMIFQHK